jgi:hypothetical protein
MRMVAASWPRYVHVLFERLTNASLGTSCLHPSFWRVEHARGYVVFILQFGCLSYITVTALEQ